MFSDTVDTQADLWRLPRWRPTPAVVPDLPPLQWLQLLSRMSAGSQGVHLTEVQSIHRTPQHSSKRAGAAIQHGCGRCWVGAPSGWRRPGRRGPAGPPAAPSAAASWGCPSRWCRPPTPPTSRCCRCPTGRLEAARWAGVSLQCCYGGGAASNTACEGLHAGPGQARWRNDQASQATGTHLLGACLQSSAACLAALWAGVQPAALEQWGLAAQAATDDKGHLSDSEHLQAREAL